jgi:2-dehydropantoate 2-reductase
MKIAILGAGALGRVYGLRLAQAHDVTFVIKKTHEPEPFQIERVDSDESHTLEEPVCAHAVPADANVVLVCVRADQLDDALRDLARPAVLLTPLMPSDWARLESIHGDKLIAGMPGVVAYTADSGAVRYWLPRSAKTLVESQGTVVEELEAALDAVGISTNREAGVQQTNAATTITFLPLTMAIAVAGSVNALLDDDALTELGLRAAEEGMAVAEGVGTAASWAPMLVKFLSPSVLKMGVALAPSESLKYVDENFGSKLRVQAKVMGAKLGELAAAKKLPHEAIDALQARL